MASRHALADLITQAAVVLPTTHSSPVDAVFDEVESNSSSFGRTDAGAGRPTGGTSRTFLLGFARERDVIAEKKKKTERRGMAESSPSGAFYTRALKASHANSELVPRVGLRSGQDA